MCGHDAITAPTNHERTFMDQEKRLGAGRTRIVFPRMRLYILRHAEAEEKRLGMSDFDRALTKRGRRQADFIAEALREKRKPVDRRPQRVISSKARRAEETAAPIARTLGIALELDTQLGTDSGVSDAEKVVRSLFDDGTECAMIVGHNPTLEQLVAKLGGNEGLRKGELVAIDVEGEGRTIHGEELGRIRGE